MKIHTINKVNQISVCVSGDLLPISGAIFTDRLRKICGGNFWQASVCPQGGRGGVTHLHPMILPQVPCPFWGTPSPSHHTSTGPNLSGGTSSPSHNTSTGLMFFQSRTEWDTPNQDKIGVPPIQSWMGFPPARTRFPACQNWGAPSGQDQPWTGYAAAGMQLQVWFPAVGVCCKFAFL